MGAEIHLVDDWYLKTDRRNYKLAKYKGKDKKDNDMWDYWVYCDSVPFLLKKLKEFEIRLADTSSLEELAETSRKVDEKIDKVLARVNPLVK